MLNVEWPYIYGAELITRKQKCKMQNAELCRMQNGECRRVHHSTFCILHSAFIPSPPFNTQHSTFTIQHFASPTAAAFSFSAPAPLPPPLAAPGWQRPAIGGTGR